MVYTIWKERNGYAVGITSCGDLFLGYINRECEFYKDTPENREFVMSQWEFNKRFAQHTGGQKNGNKEKTLER